MGEPVDGVCGGIDYTFCQEELIALIKGLEEVKSFLDTLTGTSYLETTVLPVTKDRLKTVLDSFYVADYEIEQKVKDREERYART